MRIVYLLILCFISVFANENSLDISSLPKEFREWNVRIVGEGYLRFLVPSTMELFSSSTDDEEGLYVQEALQTDIIRADPYSMSEKSVITSAQCTGDQPPDISPDSVTPGTCVDIMASCIITYTNEVISIDPTTQLSSFCETVLGSCMESSSATYSGLASITPLAKTGWDAGSHIQGDCITTYTIMTSSPYVYGIIGHTIEQVFSESDGKIVGTIESIVAGGQEFILKNVVGVAGTSNVIPTDFILNDANHPIEFVSTTGTRTPSDKWVIVQMIKERDFTSAIQKTFQPYWDRTFTPAVLGDNKFQTVYSRYGLLHINKYRLLVNVNGLLVIGKTALGNEGFIHVPEFYQTVTVKQNGQLDIKYNDGTTEYVGQLTLKTFPNKYGLNIWGNSGYEVRCNGAGGFGTSLGSWCKNTNIDGRKMWYYARTVESGAAELKVAAAFSPTRLQQYHLNSQMKDLYLGGKEPEEIW
jgi:hypothetical protein